MSTNWLNVNANAAMTSVMNSGYIYYRSVLSPVCQSLPPTSFNTLAWKVLENPKTLFSWFRCVYLGLELNSAGLDSPDVTWGECWRTEILDLWNFLKHFCNVDPDGAKRDEICSLVHVQNSKKKRFYILNVVLRIILLFFKCVDTKPKRKGMIVS